MGSGKTVHLPLMGGLGNQLFQLAAGIYVTQQSDRDVKFLSSWLNPPRVYKRGWISPRQLMISDLIDDCEWSGLSRIQAATIRVISKFGKNYWVSELGPSDDTLERITSDTRVLVGYFQKSKYVNCVREPLLKRLEKSLQFRQLIPSKLEPRIAIHMRFGDYLSNPTTRAVHGLSDVSYYVNGVQILLGEIRCNQILLVSDDPKRAYSLFTESFDCRDFEISCAPGSSELEDFALLSHSAGIVISNSSFSWWAAWLGASTFGARVIAPTPWFAEPSAADTNLSDRSWTFIKRELSAKE